MAEAVRAAFALAGTATAVAAMTVGTGHGAVFADRRVALLTIGTFVGVHRVPAVCAVDGLPRRERDVRTAVVVGSQEVGHDREEVIEPPLPQRDVDCCVAFAFAQIFLLDMGMCDAVIGAGGIGVECNHPVVAGVVAVVGVVQPDFKASEVDVLQTDRLRRDGHLFLLAVDRDVLELISQSPQVGEDVAC